MTDLCGTTYKVYTDDEEIEQLASTVVAVINSLSGDRPAQMEYVTNTIISLKAGAQEVERQRCARIYQSMKSEIEAIRRED
jgi:mRNA deadenylase 3'-5' endonuclease subunit Ccr4